MRSVILFNSNSNKLCLWIVRRYLTQLGERPVFIDTEKYPLTQLYNFYCQLAVYALADSINDSLLTEIMDGGHYLTQVTNNIDHINLSLIHSRIKIIVNTKPTLEEALWLYFFPNEQQPDFFSNKLIDDSWLAYDQALENNVIIAENKIVKLKEAKRVKDKRGSI